MGLVEKDTARLTEASREGSEQRKRPTRKILREERYRGPVYAARGRRWQWGRKKREQGERGSAIYVSISWRARVHRCSHPGWWTADGGLVRRGHLPAESSPPSAPLPPTLRADTERVGPPEDAPEDPTPFQASALLRHSRVMLLDLGDPHGWLYSGHAGRTAASNVATRRPRYIAF